jgi:hypothetical protein
MRGNMRAAAAIILVAGLSTAAQAVETGTLTLARKGTSVYTSSSAEPEDEKPEPVSTGLIVNFTAGTVQGFILPGLLTGSLDAPVKITAMNEVTVAFEGFR